MAFRPESLGTFVALAIVAAAFAAIAIETRGALEFGCAVFFGLFALVAGAMLVAEAVLDHLEGIRAEAGEGQ